MGDLNSLGPSKTDVGDTDVCGVSTRRRLTTELESRLDESELANDSRGSWLAVEFRRDRGGEERGIESCEAVSPSSSSESRDTCRFSESVGEGGGKTLEVMFTEVEGDFLSQYNYVIVDKFASLLPVVDRACLDPTPMSLLLLCLLLSPVIASPVDSFEFQVIFGQSEKPGWYDPRERGGQFLDVSGAYLHMMPKVC